MALNGYSVSVLCLQRLHLSCNSIQSAADKHPLSAHWHPLCITLSHYKQAPLPLLLIRTVAGPTPGPNPSQHLIPNTGCITATTDSPNPALALFQAGSSPPAESPETGPARCTSGSSRRPLLA
jgi:hypothetical protein